MPGGKWHETHRQTVGGPELKGGLKGKAATWMHSRRSLQAWENVKSRQTHAAFM